MGSQCSTTNLKQQFETIREFKHSTLGQIKLIRSVKTYNTGTPINSQNGINASNLQSNNGFFNRNIFGDGGLCSEKMKMVLVGDEGGIRDGQLIAVKEFRFPGVAERDKYVKIVREAGCYSKIPTLLKVYSYQIGSNRGTSNPIQLNNYRCSHSYPVNLYFAYYPSTLHQQLTQKKAYLLQNHNSHRPALPRNLKLNNYTQIDRLPSLQRKLINFYYQQVEILRFIDYIVGALYFLDHLEHSHQALCPENVMIDEQGKYALLDASVFKLRTNYEIAYSYLYGHEIGDESGDGRVSGLKYLAPQLLMHVKNKHLQHRQSSQKSEVFSIGLITLEMCLIDHNILEDDPSNKNEDFPILDKNTLKLNKNSLNKALVMVQSRYSLELVDLLALMLEYDPQKRINFSHLIDMLSPLLVKNLGDIQQLYNPQNKNSPRFPSRIQSPISKDPLTTDSHHPLIQKLAELQTNYNKIMAKTSILDSSITEQSQRGAFDQQYIINDQKRILKELKKINLRPHANKNKASFSGKEGNDGKYEIKREVKGSELYDIYLSEYEMIKKNRLR